MSEAQAQTDLSIIIVSWNVAGLLRRCLASCFAQVGGLNIEVIVVDNASADQSVAIVQGEFPAARLIVNQDNRGFPAGVNQGIATSSGRYVMLLNPDAELPLNGAATLVGYLDGHSDVGVVGPKLVHADGAWQSSRRRFPNLLTVMLESTPLQGLFARLPLRRYYMEDTPPDTEVEADWLVGACLVVRRAAIAAAGAMDAAFFMYSEELDWCQRIKAAGWRIVYLPDTTVVHHEGQSAAQAVGRRAINFNVSKLRYWAKWHGLAQARLLRGWLRLLYTAQMAAEAAKWLLGHKRGVRAARLVAYRQLLGNGLRRYVRPAARPRLALLTAEYRPQPGGVGDYTHELAKELGATVLVVGASQQIRFNGATETTDGGAQFIAPHQIETEAARDKSRPYLNDKRSEPYVQRLATDRGWGMLRGVHRALLRARIDVLNVQYQSGAYRMHPAINLLPLYLKLQGNPARVVVTFHDLLLPYWFPKAGAVRKLANWLLLKFSDAAIVTNAADAAATAAWGDKVRVVPIGSNIAAQPPVGYARNAWRQAQQVSDGDVLIAHFGLLNQSKGLDTLLYALAKLPPRFKLAIIGGGVGESDPTNRRFAAAIEAQIERLGLGPRIIRSGQLSEREVSAWLCGADMAALPFRDGASLRRGSLLAALAHGLATVSTLPPDNQAGQDKSPPYDGLPELRDGANLLLVPPDDVTALARAISTLADDRELCLQLSVGARELAAQLGWPQIGERVYQAMKG